MNNRLLKLFSRSELSRIRLISQLLTIVMTAFALAIVVIYCLEKWYNFHPTFWSYVWFFLACALIRISIPVLWRRAGPVLSIKIFLYLIGSGIVGLGIYYLTIGSTKVALRWSAFGIGILITANRVYEHHSKSH